MSWWGSPGGIRTGRTEWEGREEFSRKWFFARCTEKLEEYMRVIILYSNGYQRK